MKKITIFRHALTTLKAGGVVVLLGLVVAQSYIALEALMSLR